MFLSLGESLCGGCGQAALEAHKEQLVDDAVVHAHLAALYDRLLEHNLARLVEPFSRVQIEHVAHLIKLPLPTVLAKLSQVRLSLSHAPPASHFPKPSLYMIPCFRLPDGAGNLSPLRCKAKSRAWD